MNLDNFRQIMKDCFPDEEVHTEEDLMKWIHDYLGNDTEHYIQPAELSDLIVCIYECFEVQGYSISELSKTKKLSENDLFLASVDDAKSVNIAYSQLSSQALADTITKLKEDNYYKSMAFEDKNDYSLSSHNHQKLYSANVYAEPSKYVLSIQQLIKDEELPPDSLSVLAKLDVTRYVLSADRKGIMHKVVDRENSHTYELSCSKVKFPSPALFEPAVGELKFLPLEQIYSLYEDKLAYYGNKQNVDIFAEDFDGWVFPNGTTFACEVDDFKKAKAVFGSNNRAFTVPRLNTFINAVTDKSENDMLLKRKLQRIKIGPHAHLFNINNIPGIIEITDPEITQLKVTTSAPPDNATVYPIPENTNVAIAFFGSSNDHVQMSTGWQNSTTSVNIKEQIKLDMQTSPSDVDNNIFQPRCQLMPVLMYIGAKTYPDEGWQNT